VLAVDEKNRIQALDRKQLGLHKSARRPRHRLCDVFDPFGTAGGRKLPCLVLDLSSKKQIKNGYRNIRTNKINGRFAAILPHHKKKGFRPVGVFGLN
jgi:hypothetical protein